MKIYNSITKQKEIFKPILPGHIKMYVCGPTVYDYMHIGNARPLVVFDTIRRYLIHVGFIVNYVQNFTDVDDKIIKRAVEENSTMAEISNKYINEALRDMNGLNLLKPTVAPKVTEEIKEIIEMIQSLVESGNAYEINGDVYFHAPSFPYYGILKKIEILNQQTRLDNDQIKKHATDFVLWKAKKENEPFYSSPWGDGRPGWHIECSAMIKKYLGSTIDIHGGGMDLIFPHHENEIAQSYCSNKAPLSNYFMHNGFVNINDEKMSKSSGNFFLIRDIAKNFGYNTLRFFILSSHYRSSINFDNDLLTAAKNGVERITQAVINMKFVLENTKNENLTKEEELLLFNQNFWEQFTNAMNDDFNTSKAISIIFDYIKFANSNLEENSSKAFTKHILDEVSKLCEILGIKLNVKEKALPEEIELLINERQNARTNKNFILADKLRDKITEMGVTLEDTKNGIRWKYNE